MQPRARGPRRAHTGRRLQISVVYLRASVCICTRPASSVRVIFYTPATSPFDIDSTHISRHRYTIAAALRTCGSHIYIDTRQDDAFHLNIYHKGSLLARLFVMCPQQIVSFFFFFFFFCSYTLRVQRSYIDWNRKRVPAPRSELTPVRGGDFTYPLIIKA